MVDWSEFERQVVGKPFRWNARGPEAYDCWGLVRKGLAFAGTEYPQDWWIEESDQGTRPVRLFEEQQRNGRWQMIIAPVPGAVVAMSTHRLIHHVGLVVPAGVLQATPSTGVVRTPYHQLSGQGYRRVECYQWQ